MSASLIILYVALKMMLGRLARGFARADADDGRLI